MYPDNLVSNKTILLETKFRDAESFCLRQALCEQQAPEIRAVPISSSATASETEHGSKNSVFNWFLRFVR
jgi:hypothetical protein